MFLKSGDDSAARVGCAPATVVTAESNFSVLRGYGSKSLTRNFTWRGGGWPGEPLAHDAYHCGFGITFGDESERFVVSHQASIARAVDWRVLVQRSMNFQLICKILAPAQPRPTRQNLARPNQFPHCRVPATQNKCA